MGTRVPAAAPAVRAGRCDCCVTPYPAGTPIVREAATGGWVLAVHPPRPTAPVKRKWKK